MTKYYPDTDVTFEYRNKNSSGALISASSLSFKSKLNTDSSVTATPTEGATGVYTVSVTPTEDGVLHALWTVTNSGVTKTITDKAQIHNTAFEDA